MHVESIGYQNSSQIRFYGTVNGQKSTLIQHVSQLNLLLLASKKLNPDDSAPPRRIGFVTDSEEDE